MLVGVGEVAGKTARQMLEKSVINSAQSVAEIPLSSRTLPCAPQTLQRLQADHRKQEGVVAWVASLLTASPL